MENKFGGKVLQVLVFPEFVMRCTVGFLKAQRHCYLKFCSFSKVNHIWRHYKCGEAVCSLLWMLVG